jgi:hypothetical protein
MKDGAPAGGLGRAPVTEARAKKNQRTATRNAIVETLARSTAPISDIADRTPKFKVAPFAAAGVYKVRPLTTETATIQVDPRTRRQDAEHTLLHEMGHHADYESDRIDFLSRYNQGRSNRAGPPGLEGAAEGYAAKHVVHRRNAPAEYKDTASYPRLRRNATFQEHFERVSGKSLIDAMGGDLRDDPVVTAERSLKANGGLQDRLFHGMGSRYVTRDMAGHNDEKLRELDTIPVRYRDRKEE